MANSGPIGGGGEAAGSAGLNAVVGSGGIILDRSAGSGGYGR